MVGGQRAEVRDGMPPGSAASRSWPVPLASAGRVLVGAGIAAALLLLPVAVALQPAFDLRQDLVSDLAAHGATRPELGQAVVLGLGLAYAGLALTLLARRSGLAASAALLGAACLLGVAAAQISCPGGAHGCSGPHSGRPLPRPAADVMHRDLVAVFEVATVVLLVSVAGRLGRRRLRRSLTLSALAAASVVFLGGQQRGVDIGWWQLGWIASVVVGIGAVQHSAERDERRILYVAERAHAPL